MTDKILLDIHGKEFFVKIVALYGYEYYSRNCVTYMIEIHKDKRAKSKVWFKFFYSHIININKKTDYDELIEVLTNAIKDELCKELKLKTAS